jgi:hypothetical protein
VKMAATTAGGHEGERDTGSLTWMTASDPVPTDMHVGIPASDSQGLQTPMVPQ